MLHSAVFWHFFNDIGTKKSVSKKVFPIFFSCIFYVKTNLHFSNKNIFNRYKYASPKASNKLFKRGVEKYQTSKQGGIAWKGEDK